MTLVEDHRRVSKEGTELSNLVLDASDLDCQEKSQKKSKYFYSYLLATGQNRLELFCRAVLPPSRKKTGFFAGRFFGHERPYRPGAVGEAVAGFLDYALANRIEALTHSGSNCLPPLH